MREFFSKKAPLTLKALIIPMRKLGSPQFLPQITQLTLAMRRQLTAKGNKAATESEGSKAALLR